MRHFVILECQNSKNHFSLSKTKNTAVRGLYSYFTPTKADVQGRKTLVHKTPSPSVIFFCAHCSVLSCSVLCQSSFFYGMPSFIKKLRVVVSTEGIIFLWMTVFFLPHDLISVQMYCLGAELMECLHPE